MRTRFFVSVLFLLLAGLVGALGVSAGGAGTSLTAADGPKLLKDGNSRFVSGAVVYPNQTRFTRDVISHSLRPWRRNAVSSCP